MRIREVGSVKPIDIYTKFLLQDGLKPELKKDKADNLEGEVIHIFDNYELWRMANPQEHESKLRNFLKKSFPPFHSRSTRVFRDQSLLQTHSCYSACLLGSGNLLMSLTSGWSYTSLLAEVTPNLDPPAASTKPVAVPIKTWAKVDVIIRKCVMYNDVLVLCDKGGGLWQVDTLTADKTPAKVQLPKALDDNVGIQNWGTELIYVDKDSRALVLGLSPDRQLQKLAELKSDRRDSFLAVSCILNNAYLVLREGKYGNLVIQRRQHDKIQDVSHTLTIPLEGGLAAGVEKLKFQASEQHVFVGWKQSELSSHHQKSMTCTTQLLLLSADRLLLFDKVEADHKNAIAMFRSATVRGYSCMFVIYERETVGVYCIDHNKLRLVGNIRSMFGTASVTEAIVIDRQEEIVHPLTLKPTKVIRTALVIFGTNQVIDELRF